MSSLNFDPLISPALWLLFAAAGAGLFVWYGLSRPARVSRPRWAVILSLAVAGFVAVLIVLLNPTWIEPIRPPEGKPTVTVVVDATASMATVDGSEGISRFRSAAAIARTVSHTLADRFDVKIQTFGNGPATVDLDGLDKVDPAGESTDLAAAVQAGIGADRPNGQAVVFLSDGIHTVGSVTRVTDACRTAKAMACPIFTRTLGGDAEVKDLAIELRAPQEIGFVGQKVTMSAVVRNRGYAGTAAQVTLHADGKEVARKSVPLTATGVAECRFEIGQPKTGVYRYSVGVEPYSDEVTRGNNAALLVLRVVDRPVKVLLLEGKPYWDGKFLVRTLVADPSVELNTVVRVGDDRFLRRTVTRTVGPTPPPPTDEWAVLPDAAAVFAAADGLKGYQIVVLGRDADVFLSDAVLTRLQEWVTRDGGCLVCYRGSPTSRTNLRLGKLLPVRWTPTPESRFQVKLTARGQDLQLFPTVGEGVLGDPLLLLPDLATTSRSEPSKPLAVVLATTGTRDATPTEPVLSYQPYGGGRVVVIEGAGMWRWAFLPPDQQQLDAVYRSVWHGLMRWLVSTADLLPGQTMALRAEKVRFGPTESAAVTLMMRDGGASSALPTIELHGGKVRDVRTATPVPLGEEPGTFRAVFGQLPEGQYEARVRGAPENDATSTTVFEVRNPSTERLDLKARSDLMARIAEESGGASLDGKKSDDLAAVIERHWKSTRPKQVERTPAWDRAWVLVGIMALWATAWGLRRSAGLI